jgi:hypothetical protein
MSDSDGFRGPVKLVWGDGSRQQPQPSATSGPPVNSAIQQTVH